jgi:hypothetical protein
VNQQNFSTLSFFFFFAGAERKEEGSHQPTNNKQKERKAMKGMQKGKFRAQQGGMADLEPTGFEVSPMQVFVGTAVFIISVILLHFYGKLTGGSSS